MDEYFMIPFKKGKAEFDRGLSINETKKLPELNNHYENPEKIPPRHSRHLLTIVWDLDQTLVSAEGLASENSESKNLKLVIRPRAIEVLNILRSRQEAEFIVWTAGIPEHAKRVVHSLGIDYFDYIISRSKYWDVIKDLNMLEKTGRSLNTMILVDDRMDIGEPHPENLLIVPRFVPDECGPHDMTMLYLGNILYRCCVKYVEAEGKLPLRMFLHSPLTIRCRDLEICKGDYYGVNCFLSKQQLKDRLREFKR